MLTPQQTSNLTIGDKILFKTGIGPYAVSGQAVVVGPKEKGEPRRLLRCKIESFSKQEPSSRHKVGDEESFLTEELTLPEISTD